MVFEFIKVTNVFQKEPKFRCNITLCLKVLFIFTLLELEVFCEKKVYPITLGLNSGFCNLFYFFIWLLQMQSNSLGIGSLISSRSTNRCFWMQLIHVKKKVSFVLSAKRLHYCCQVLL